MNHSVDRFKSDRSSICSAAYDYTLQAEVCLCSNDVVFNSRSFICSTECGATRAYDVPIRLIHNNIDN